MQCPLGFSPSFFLFRPVFVFVFVWCGCSVYNGAVLFYFWVETFARMPMGGEEKTHEIAPAVRNFIDANFISEARIEVTQTA